MRKPATLTVLDDAIDARVSATRAAHPSWPCQRGCDLCCRSLPHLPTITRAEWRRVEHALGLLPTATRQQIEERTQQAPRSGPLTCPMLDPSTGACLVYAARPIACRTYGYYTERDAGLHCSIITRELEDRGATADVVWGNGEAVARALREHGEPASLRAWITRSGSDARRSGEG